MPAFMILLAATLWGLIGPAAMLATQAGLPPVAMAFWRALLAGVLFAALARGALVRPPARELAGMMTFGAIGIAVMYAAFFQSVRYNGAPLAAILLYTGPVWVALIEAVGRRRVPDGMTLLALVLAIGGVVTVSWRPASGGGDVAIIWGLLSGLAFSAHFTMAPPYIKKHGAAVVYAIAMLTATAVLLPVTGVSIPPAGALPYVLYVGVGATFAASYAFAAGVVQVAPVRAAVLSTIEPMIATLASAVLLSIQPSLQQLYGAALILAGVVISVTRR